MVVSRTGIDSSVQYTRNISVADYEGCIDSLPQGRYRLQVFDWLSNGWYGHQHAHNQFFDIVESTGMNRMIIVLIEQSLYIPAS